MDHGVNFFFTWFLIGFLTLLCAITSFTDSVTDKEGNTYYGLVTLNGLKLFNGNLSELQLFDEAEKEKRLDELRRSKKLRFRDFLHAFLRSAVFMALAFCDGGVQRCLVPLESWQWKSFLTNLPLAVGFLAGFVFMIFPSSRNGIGDDGPSPPADTKTGDSSGEHYSPQSNTHKSKEENEDEEAQKGRLINKEEQGRLEVELLAGSSTVSYEIDQVV